MDQKQEPVQQPQHLKQEGQPQHPQVKLGDRPQHPQVKLGDRPQHPQVKLGDQLQHPKVTLGDQLQHPKVTLGDQLQHPKVKLGAQLQPQVILAVHNPVQQHQGKIFLLLPQRPTGATQMVAPPQETVVEYKVQPRGTVGLFRTLRLLEAMS